jgi:PAS domain S-box-containing protein
MPFYYTPYIILPLLSALVNGALAIYAWPRRHTPAAGWFFLLVFGMSGWSLTYALNTAATELWLKNMFFKLAHPFFCLVLLACVPMLLLVAGMVKEISRKAVILFGLIPFISSIAGITNDQLGLIRHSMHLVSRDGLILMGYQDGWYFTHIHIKYVYLYYIVVLCLCLAGMVRKAQQRRFSLFMILVATFIPLVTDMLNLTPVKELRLTTSALFISGICYWLAVFRGNIINLVPLAREALFEQLGQPVIVVDKDRKLSQFNREAALRFAIPTNALGRQIEELFPSSHPLHLLCDATCSGTLTVTDGDRCWQVSASLLKNRGATVGTMYVCTDVTDLNTAKNALAAGEEKFRRLAEESADMVWQLDLQLCFTYANTAHTAMLGYAPDELIGLPATNFMDAIDAELISNANRERIRKEREGVITGPVRYEIRLRCNDGRMLWTEVHANPLRDHLQQISGYIGVTRDISARKADEQRLAAALESEKEARAEQEQFLAMLSHEYRTPLAIIQSNLDLLELQEQEADGSDSTRIESMKRAINRLVEVMGSSLDRSRLVQQEIIPAFEPFSLIAFLDEVIDSAEGLWGNRLFMFTPESGTVHMQGNRSQLKTVLLNLLDNACKYSPEQTPIIITCGETEGMATVTVSNSGVPLSRNDCACIFEKFRRGSNSQGTAGAGLGLWLVQQIVEQHGGSVTLSSTVETGTTVTLMLPTVAETV